MTLVVQSSSATITALLASVGQSKDAKRTAAVLHLVSKEVLRCGHMVKEMLEKVYDLSEKNEALLLTEILKYDIINNVLTLL